MDISGVDLLHYISCLHFACRKRPKWVRNEAAASFHDSASSGLSCDLSKPKAIRLPHSMERGRSLSWLCLLRLSSGKRSQPLVALGMRQSDWHREITWQAAWGHGRAVERDRGLSRLCLSLLGCERQSCERQSRKMPQPLSTALSRLI